MSRNKHIYLGPYIEFPPTSRPYDALEDDDDSLRYAFPMGGAKQNVWFPNQDVLGAHFCREDGEDMAIPCDDHEDSKRAFRQVFGEQVEKLRKHFGSTGTIRYGLVVWWG
jgi:hypothetical protein